jgi:hypothetical protein
MLPPLPRAHRAPLAPLLPPLGNAGWQAPRILSTDRRLGVPLEWWPLTAYNHMFGVPRARGFVRVSKRNNKHQTAERKAAVWSIRKFG